MKSRWTKKVIKSEKENQQLGKENLRTWKKNSLKEIETLKNNQILEKKKSLN